VQEVYDEVPCSEESAEKEQLRDFLFGVSHE
jgi:hypothetical protein